MFTFLSNSQVLFKSRKHTLWFPQSFIRLSLYMVLHHLGVWMDLMEAKYTLCGVAAQWWIYCMVCCCFHSTRLASVWSVSQSMSLLDKSTFLLMLLDIAIMCDLCFYLLCNECCCIWQSILSPTIHLYRCNCTTELQEQQQHLWRRLPWTIRDYPCWFTASIDMPDIWMFTSDEPGLDLIHSHTLLWQQVVCCVFDNKQCSCTGCRSSFEPQKARSSRCWMKASNPRCSMRTSQHFPCRNIWEWECLDSPSWVPIPQENWLLPSFSMAATFASVRWLTIGNTIEDCRVQHGDFHQCYTESLATWRKQITNWTWLRHGYVPFGNWFHYDLWIVANKSHMV